MYKWRIKCSKESSNRYEFMDIMNLKVDGYEDLWQNWLYYIERNQKDVIHNFEG